MVSLCIVCIADHPRCIADHPHCIADHPHCRRLAHRLLLLLALSSPCRGTVLAGLIWEFASKQAEVVLHQSMQWMNRSVDPSTRQPVNERTASSSSGVVGLVGGKTVKGALAVSCPDT